ncbi:EamA family transporter [Bacteroidota bacterium]
MKDQKIRAYFAWIAICFIWGTTYLAIRVGVNQLPPMLFAGLRWVIAGPLFLTILLIRGFKLPKRKDLIHIAIVGISLLGIANGLVVVAEQWIPSGLAALLITTLPFWVFGIESVLPSGPKFNINVLLGLFLGFLGVGLIFINDLKFLFNSEYFLGMICLLGAVISWASGSLYSKHKNINVHPLVNASVQMIIAGLAQISLGLVLGEFSRFYFDLNSFLAFSYLVFVGAILGYGSYIYAISHLPVSFVTTYAYINPVIALLLGWLILNEELNFIIILAAAIILVGVWMVKKGSKI